MKKQNNQRKKGEVNLILAVSFLIFLGTISLASSLILKKTKFTQKTKASSNCSQINEISYSPSLVNPGEVFTCKITTDGLSPYTMACGWSKNGGWPQGQQSGSCQGKICTFQVKMDENVDSNANYELVAFDFRENCGPQSGKRIVLEIKNSSSPASSSQQTEPEPSSNQQSNNCRGINIQRGPCQNVVSPGSCAFRGESWEDRNWYNQWVYCCENGDWYAKSQEAQNNPSAGWQTKEECEGKENEGKENLENPPINQISTPTPKPKMKKPPKKEPINTNPTPPKKPPITSSLIEPTLPQQLPTLTPPIYSSSLKGTCVATGRKIDASSIFIKCTYQEPINPSHPCSYEGKLVKDEGGCKIMQACNQSPQEKCIYRCYRNNIPVNCLHAEDIPKDNRLIISNKTGGNIFINSIILEIPKYIGTTARDITYKIGTCFALPNNESIVLNLDNERREGHCISYGHKFTAHIFYATDEKECRNSQNLLFAQGSDSCVDSGFQIFRRIELIIDLTKTQI